VTETSVPTPTDEASRIGALQAILIPSNRMGRALFRTMIAVVGVGGFIGSEDDYRTKFPGVMIEVVDFILDSPPQR
jgi:hypothetical protein